MKDKIFGVLQRVGRSFMLPIAILPIAGLLLGIGSSFTNRTMLEAYKLSWLIHPGGFLYTLLDVMSHAGSVVFDNLALLFAIGVSIGMAKKEKEVAALSGVVAFLVMNVTIGALIDAKGGVEAMLENSTSSVLGITTLQMGVFGGIIVGLGVAALHNKFYRVKFPAVFAFFGGTRFVPIISALVYLLVGILMFFVWPLIQKGITMLGSLVLASGYWGTWIYGIIERALIPFGLHHVFYIPFWQTSVGGSMVIDGILVQGAQNIYFAQLASKTTEAFSVSATRFMSGKFPFMIFGLPGAAYAMYQCAKPHKKKVAGGLLLSAALTSMLTGITEPLEFTFIFVAPLMYAVHCILAGLSFMLMHIFNVGVGMTFSGGLIDLVLFGVLQGNAKTNWIYIVLVGVVYFFVYWGIFSVMIKKFNYITPGREDDDAETKLYTRADVDARKNTNVQSELIVKGLGGKENIADIDCCATRLRITVKDSSKISKDCFKSAGASGTVVNGNGVQIIFGPTVTVVKSNLEEYLDVNINETMQSFNLSSPVSGDIFELKKVNDGVFSEGILGNGIAIEPKEGAIYAPCNAIITNTVSTGHAIGLRADEGFDILIHVGIDTVNLKGRFFKYVKNEGEYVKKGELLMRFDADEIKNAGYRLITPIVISDGKEYSKINILKEGRIEKGERLLEILYRKGREV